MTAPVVRELLEQLLGGVDLRVVVLEVEHALQPAVDLSHTTRGDQGHLMLMEPQLRKNPR